MTLDLTVPARPPSLRRVREALRGWLDGIGWPHEERESLVFIVSEAVSNAVEHAYPEDAAAAAVIVRAHEEATETGREVLVSISDHGVWRPAPPDDEGRRRGLPLMRAFARRVHVDSSDRGTTVTIASHVLAVGPGRRRAHRT